MRFQHYALCTKNVALYILLFCLFEFCSQLCRSKVQWDLKTIYDLVNQRPPHLKFRGFPTLMASRFSKGAKHNPLPSCYLLLISGLHTIYHPETLAFKRIPKVDLLRSKLDHLLPYVIITKSHTFMLDIIFHQIMTFIKVHVAYTFGLQVL